VKLQLDKKTGKYKRFSDPMLLVNLAVMEASSANAPEGWLHHLEVSKISSSNVQSDPKTGLKSVHAIGEGVLKTHRLKDDAYFGGKPQSWEIQFKEGYDDIGAPDIDVINFKLLG
jgi:hypothetical protein